MFRGGWLELPVLYVSIKIFSRTIYFKKQENKAEFQIRLTSTLVAITIIYASEFSSTKAQIKIKLCFQNRN